MMMSLKVAGRQFFPILHIAAYYPLFLVITFGLNFIVWGFLLNDYDAFHLVWSDDPYTGIASGIIAAGILGEVMLAVYILDRQRSQNANLPTVSAYYISWLLFIALYISPLVWHREPIVQATPVETKTEINPTQIPMEGPRWWFAIGMLIVPVAAPLICWLIPWTRKHPSYSGFLITVVLLLGYLLMCVAHSFFPTMYSPILPAPVSILMMLTFITATVATMTYLAYFRHWCFYPCILIVFIAPFLFPAFEQEHHFPNMDYSKPVRLALYDDFRKLPANDVGLLDDKTLLQEKHAALRKKYHSTQPVVVVTCSGGASASAIYTADVLFTMEQQHPYFSDRIHIVTGASGGMLGAAYFVTQLLPGGIIGEARKDPIYIRYVDAVNEYQEGKISEKELSVAAEKYRSLMSNCRKQFFEGLEADFLGPIVQKWVHKDAPLSPYGLIFGVTTNDRGFALEQAWSKHLRQSLDIKFRDLRKHERDGLIPSLIFTPMMVEDGRQLIISNRDLDYMTESGRFDNHDLPLSLMGVEFFRLFPKAEDFRLSTAVRMNASFPFFSPATALPTDPVRHVVDAGYYDNYGMVAAMKWLNHHKEFFEQQFHGDKAGDNKEAEIILLRIRCFGYERNSKNIPTQVELDRYSEVNKLNPESALSDWKQNEHKQPIHTESGYYTIAAPFAALFASWRSNMVYRADERLASMYQMLKFGKVKLSDHLLLCDIEPSLNWKLASQDITRIHNDVQNHLLKPSELENFYSKRPNYPPIKNAPPPIPTKSKLSRTIQQSIQDQSDLVKFPFTVPKEKK